MLKSKRNRWNKVTINRYLAEHQTNVWLINDTFETTKYAHNWECLFGHQFLDKFEALKKRIGDVTGGRAACKVCRTKHSREEQIRFVFCQIFDQEFPKKSPSWLRQENGASLHFDGFNEDLMLAFEHDGEQHFHHIEHFHPTLEDFEAAQKRDEIKNGLCAENNVHLLRIRYDVALDCIPNFIRDNLPDQLKSKINLKNINWSKFPSSVNSANSIKISKLKKHAEQNGGELLSDQIGVDGRVEFICFKHEYQWLALADVILQRGDWCVKCGHEKRASNSKKSWSAKELKSLGQAFEPPLCFEEWAGVDEKGRYLWSCKGHNCKYPFARKVSELEAKLKTNRLACPGCNKKRKRQLWEAHNFAEKKGGVCLTTSGFKNKSSMLKFKCHNYEHDVFELTGNQIFDSKMWCPKCQDRKLQKIPFAQVKEQAFKKGFDLLGNYKNNTEKLELKCRQCGALNSDLNYRALERLDLGNNCDHCRIL